MSDQANNEAEANADQANSTPNADLTNLLTSIKNDSGQPKYADVNAALGSIAPSQEHIKKLEEENATLKAEVDKRQSSQEILDQIVSATKTPANEATPASESMDQEAISQLIANTLDSRSAADKASANVKVVADALQAQYKDKSSDMFALKTAEAGVSPEFMKSIIAQSPEAALNLLGLKAVAVNTNARIESSQNTENFNHNAGNQLKPTLGNTSHAEKMASWAAHSPS